MTTSTAFGKKELYSPSKLPLLVMMLTGGVAGSIAEVYSILYRLLLFLLIQLKLDYNYKDKADKHPSIQEC
jgi:hypothetical protein